VALCVIRFDHHLELAAGPFLIFVGVSCYYACVGFVVRVKSVPHSERLQRTFLLEETLKVA